MHPTITRRPITMSTVLVAETGRATGSAASRRLRAEDSIPAVVYGQGMEPISISVKRRELRHALSGQGGMNTVLDLKVDGKVYPAIVKQVQRHPVRRTVSHVDFLQVNLDEEITVSVPLHLEGEAKEVLANGGLVDPAVDSIEVSSRPGDIPGEITIDVTNMTMDTVIRLSDIRMPPGVTALADPDTPLVTVLVMKASELESEAEAEAAAEAAAAEAEGEGAPESAGDAAAQPGGEASGGDAAK
jgi:large subunit ribosomal protein L25